MKTKRTASPTDLNDTEWKRIKPLLPAKQKKGKRKYPLREIVNAMFYIVKSGCAWRLLPHDLPHWKTVYTYFWTWRNSGVWEHINTALCQQVRRRTGRRAQPRALVMDSQTVKTAEGGEARGYDGGKHVTGRKRHVIVDTLGLLVLVVVTTAHVQDCHAAAARQVLHTLFERLAEHLKRLQVIFADGAYRGDLIDWVKQSFGWTIQVVLKLGTHVGFQVLKKRWVVERTFAWLNRSRRLSKDFERTTQSSETMIYIASARLLLRRLANNPSV